MLSRNTIVFLLNYPFQYFKKYQIKGSDYPSGKSERR